MHNSLQPSSSVARRMSRASAAYDRGNKGFLDNTERVVRKYDVDGDGVISINEVFKIVEDLSDYKHQKQNLKKYLWMSVMFGMVLLLSVFALMWATIILTRQVTVNGDDSALVSTSTGRILSTKAVGSSLTVDSISTEQQRQRKLQKEIGRKLVGTVEKDRFKRAFGLLRENMDPPTTVEITLRFKDPDGVVSAQLFRAHDYTYTEFNNDAFRIAGLVPASLTTSPDGDDQAMLSYHVDCPKKEEAKCEIFQSIPFVPVVSGVTKTEAVIWFRTDPSFPVRVLVSLQPDPTTLDYQLAFPPFESEATYSSGAESDYTGSIKLTGLNPGTKYFYTVLVHGTHAVTSFRERYGFFQTFPDAGNPFSFTIFADVAFYYVDQPARAYKYGGNKESEEPEHLFALQIGDFDHSDPTNLEEIRTMNQQLRDPSRKHGRSLAANILTKASFNHICKLTKICLLTCMVFASFVSVLSSELGSTAMLIL